MKATLSQLIDQYDEGKLTRRQLVASLAAVAGVGSPQVRFTGDPHRSRPEFANLSGHAPGAILPEDSRWSGNLRQFHNPHPRHHFGCTRR